MMRSIRQPLLFAAGLLVLPLVHAEDAPPPPVGWTGKGEAGAVLARGNADTTTADVKFDGTDSFGNWKETAHLAFLYGQSAGFSTAQRLEGAWQTDYNFSKKTFVFGYIAGENDRFDGFVYQVTLATGLGQKLIETDTTKLTVTAGFVTGACRSRHSTRTPTAAWSVATRAHRPATVLVPWASTISSS